MTTSEILEKAAALIEPEGAWTQGTFARNATGQHVNYNDVAAVCWCARGALTLAGDSLGANSDERVRAYRALRSVVPQRRGNAEPVATWQDNSKRTQAEVVAALRDAAKAAS